MANLVDDVQVILYVFKRTIIGQLSKQGLNVFLRSAHHCPPLPLRFNKSSKMRIAFCSAIVASCEGAFDFDFKPVAAAASFTSASSGNFAFDSGRRFTSARSNACMASR